MNRRLFLGALLTAPLPVSAEPWEMNDELLDIVTASASYTKAQVESFIASYYSNASKAAKKSWGYENGWRLKGSSLSGNMNVTLIANKRSGNFAQDVVGALQRKFSKNMRIAGWKIT